MPKVMVPNIENKIFLIRGRRVMLDADLAAVYRVPTKVLNRAVKRNDERFPEDFMFRLTREEVEILRSQFATSSEDAPLGMRHQNGTASREVKSMRSRSVTASKKSALNLRYQFGTSSSTHGGRRYLPYAFTEHGAVMLASVLNSPVAIEASIHVVRAFLQFRSILAAHKELAEKISELEKKYDGQFEILFAAIKRLIAPPPEPSSKRPMGF